MNKSTLVAIIVSLVAVVLAGLALTKDTEAPTVKLSGYEPVQRVVAYGGFARGGQFTIATTASAMTLTDKDLANNAVISVTAMGAGQAALALTLPASTTWPSLDKPGVVQSWIIDNNGLNAATTTTITAGTGVDIDGTGSNDDVLNGDVSGRLDCWRLPSTGNIRCIVEEMVDAG